MKQIPLDIGWATGPTLTSYFSGSNAEALCHLKQWVRSAPLTGLQPPVPVYLWGAASSGKTHLLKAVKEYFRARGATVGWLDASVMTPPDYDEQWAVVLLDEVHLYTDFQQHAAFNWFVNAQTFQCGVLGAGDLPPADLKLRDDLRTRLGWGHVFQLQLLGETECRAVLRLAAEAKGLFLSEDVVDFMLTRFSRDLGSLMELLDLIDGYALQTKRGISIPLIKSMMDNS